jgi:hypothetical protein
MDVKKVLWEVCFAFVYFWFSAAVGEEEALLVDPIPPLEVDVNATILRKVMEWCEQHRDDPPPLAYNDDELKGVSAERMIFQFGRI